MASKFLTTWMIFVVIAAATSGCMYNPGYGRRGYSNPYYGYHQPGYGRGGGWRRW